MANLALKTSPDIAHALKRLKANYKARGKVFYLRKPRLLEPRAVENEYVAAVQDRLALMYDYIKTTLVGRLESLMRQGQLEQGVRMDADFDEEFRSVINGIQVEFGRRLSEAEISGIARYAAHRVSTFNKAQNDKLFRSVLGIDIFRSEPWVARQITAFAAENARLIKSVEENLLKDIQVTVYNGVRQGLTAKAVASSIRERFRLTDSRAELIARDQIQKLNGQMTRVRQTELGVTKYIWRTALDQRVRPEHSRREGQIFKWSKPPDDGHPGEAVNCRCYAEPVLEDLV